MANPRNAAAGSLRQLDPKICAERKLDIQVFNLQLAEGKTFPTHSETLDYLASQHFKVIPHKTLSDPAEIQAEIDRINDERMDYPFDIDGAVVKSKPPVRPGAAWAPPPSSPSGRWPSSTRRRRSPPWSRTSWCRWAAPAC